MGQVLLSSPVLGAEWLLFRSTHGAGRPRPFRRPATGRRRALTGTGTRAAAPAPITRSCPFPAGPLPWVRDASAPVRQRDGIRARPRMPSRCRSGDGAGGIRPGMLTSGAWLGRVAECRLEAPTGFNGDFAKIRLGS